jgi:predicted nucleic acid-binding protein
MTIPKIVVHTDVFVDHLRGSHSPSLLRLAMSRFFCYTTVFQAIQLFSLAKSERECRVIEDSMAALKLMGLNPKQARRYGELMAKATQIDTLNILIAGLCLESRLPILTNRREDFRGIRGLVVVPAGLVKQFESGQEILHAAR